MRKFAEMGAAGQGSYEDYFNEYMNRPELKAIRFLKRLGYHMIPIAAGGLIGKGIGNGEESDRNAWIGGGTGALLSALMYGPIKRRADRTGEEDAWRYAAARSGKVGINDVHV